SRLAKNGNPQTYPLPRPMIGSLNYDFSFSGLKTAVLNLVRKNNWDFSDPVFAEKNQSLLVDLCASVEQAIIDVLVHKTIKAAKEHNINSILLGGGVAANGKLKQTLLMELQSHFANKATLFVPSPQFCTDNGAMIAAAGFFATSKPWQEIDANPELYY
ncbi:MAG TPA: tRNA (adenosine(37)-N6)-threonylcarbamoyltransferase complex transferase subunit TsaD, partial [Patescibacteria group bacterium]|nr:tRNA (adenosine(37)-N6)-threonylcarbamoyltransferase complex transferase subunit TsaD [Patescibacteria group bacterium]